METGLVTDPIYAAHLTGESHPEAPERYHSIRQALKSTEVVEIKPRDASEDEVLLCHTRDYLTILKNDVQRCAASGVTNGNYTISTGDTQICPESYQIAIRAVGAVLAGVDAVLKGMCRNAFCLIRPPGHHACSNKGMGFCLFNNIAIAARYAQFQHKIGKILIIDWDVHHGNGTQEIFYSDPSVFYFSTHQSPLYPGTGKKEERGLNDAFGTILNCPISPNNNSRIEVLNAFKEQLVPRMREFKPELVFISAGFDAHERDPLGGLNLTDDDFSHLTQIAKEIAQEHAEGKLISALEGGYDLQAIASAAKAHVECLRS